MCGWDVMLLACDATCDMCGVCEVWRCASVCGCVVCSLWSNDLGAEGARALASCLGGLTGLQTLSYVR